MDGNRRYAKSRYLPAIMGHKDGFLNIVKIIESAIDNKIDTLTLYALSKDNVTKRDAGEIDHIFNLILTQIGYTLPFSIKNNLKVSILGSKENMPEKVLKTLADLEFKTSNGTGMHLQLCINYDGREEILQAVQKIVNNKISNFKNSNMVDKSSPNQANQSDPNVSIDNFVTLNDFESALYSSKEPDIIIRTGGDSRISGFLLWQQIYSELYFVDKMWPEFGKDDFVKIIEDYKLRKRRYGK